MNIKFLSVHNKHGYCVERFGKHYFSLLPDNMPFEFLTACLSLCDFSFLKTLRDPLPASKHGQLKRHLLHEAHRDDRSSDR